MEKHKENFLDSLNDLLDFDWAKQAIKLFSLTSQKLTLGFQLQFFTVHIKCNMGRFPRKIS